MSQVDFILPLALLLAVVPVVRLWRSRQRPWTLSISVGILVLYSSGLVAAFLSMLLESRYDGRQFSDTAEAIVVLCGGISPAKADQPYDLLAQDTYARSVEGAWLYHSGPSRPVLVTGRDCAPAMARFLATNGIPPTGIWEDNLATNTHENAVYSARILGSHRIHKVALITDADSMLRAELCFRKQALEVVPMPAGLGTFELSPGSFVPSWKAMRSNTEALHEILGLIWYKCKGWI